MKIVLHIFGILLLFAAILAGPTILEELRGPSSPEPPPAAEQQAVEETKKPDMPNMPPQPVPADVEFEPRENSSRGSGIESASGGEGGDSFMVGGQNIKDKLVPGSFDGGSGDDSLVADGAGWASLDGMQLRSFEFFRFRNGQPNLLHVLAMGLETTDHGKITVEGDAEIDSVWLDPEIGWGKPVTDSGYAIYEGKDAGGRLFTVSITQGVKVEIGRQ